MEQVAEHFEQDVNVDPDTGEVSGKEPTAQEYAQQFLLGSLINAATKHLKTLSRAWIDMREEEQKVVLHCVQNDCRQAVSTAVDIIASNARRTFPAKVGRVSFQSGTVSIGLSMVNDDDSHALADVSGAFVTLVIEDSSILLQSGDSTATEGDQKSLI